MSLTAVEIAQVLSELRRLEGVRVRRIHQQDPYTLLLRTRHDILCISCNPRACRIHFLDPLPPRIAARDFCQLSRRRLEGRRIATISQPEGDRCVRIRFESEPELSLLAELTGRHANVLALQEEMVLGSLVPNRSAKRMLLPGRTYTGLLPAPASRSASSRFSDEHPSADIDAHYTPLLASWRLEQLRQTVTRPLRRQLSGRRKLVKNLRADREAHQGALKGQRAGDLLLAQLHRVQPRTSSVTLTDLFYGGEGEPPELTVALDPRLSPADNAQRHYRRASKARRGIADLDRRIPRMQREVTDLEAALARLEASDGEALERLAATLDAPTPRKKRSRAKKNDRREPYHRFRSGGGLPILVGRSAADNHRLTFSVARGRDVWMHARDVTGSHVVLRLDRGGDPPHESLLDAACLAKHYSAARSAAHADISWTLRKHVRSSSTPGRVYLADSHTLRVADDPDRLRRLFQTRSETGRLLTGLEPD